MAGSAPSAVDRQPPRRKPADALAELLAGNRRFVSGRPRYGHDVTAAAAASGGQQPYAVVLGCIDSRVPLEAVFDQGFGSICVVRSGGHVLECRLTEGVLQIDREADLRVEPPPAVSLPVPDQTASKRETLDRIEKE